MKPPFKFKQNDRVRIHHYDMYTHSWQDLPGYRNMKVTLLKRDDAGNCLYGVYDCDRKRFHRTMEEKELALND